MRSCLLCFLIFLPKLQLGLRPLPCGPQRQLFATFDGLREALAHFDNVYGSFAQARPKVVAEHVRAYQLHALAQDFLEVVEAFRLFACLALCPQACWAPEIGPPSPLGKVQLVERLNDLQLDMELVVEEANPEFKLGSQRFLREAKRYASSLMATAPQSGAGVDWDEGLTVCVSNVISRLMFPLLRVVASMSRQNQSHIILGGITMDIEDPASSSASYISPGGAGWQQLDEEGKPPFAEAAQLPGGSGELAYGMLRSLATNAQSLRLSVGPTHAAAGICRPALSPFLLHGGHSAWPRRWQMFNEPDQEGLPRIVQMLQHIEGSSLDLSHMFVVLRPGSGLATFFNFSCTGTEVEYDPTLCLEDRGWGGYVYSVNVHPPFRAELRILARNIGDSALSEGSTYVDILNPYPHQPSVETVSLEHMFYRVDFIWRQANEPSPDVFFVHPSVHNCHAVEYLFSGAPLKPKILVIPINPLIPPPFEVMPRFEAWWHLLRPALRSSHSGRAWVEHSDKDTSDDYSAADNDTEPDTMDTYLMPSFWFAQCSLAAVDSILKGMVKKKFKYTLHHVDRSFAVYAREDLYEALKVKQPQETKPSLFSHWLEGWHCVPDSRYYAKLELTAGVEIARLADPEVPIAEKEASLCRFLDNQRIPVQKRNFDCASVVSRGRDSGAGEHSCLQQDFRGWGNEASVSDSMQSSAEACETHCLMSNCSYWTFDPTSMYGSPLCWVWVQGRPAEIKPEPGWISGDADCHITLTSGETENQTTQDTADSHSVTEQQPAAQGRELFRQWSIAQQREMPGMRYFLESGQRGRCTQGFCECYPPYRGPLCEQLDPGSQDGNRNYTGVLHYLTSDDPEDVEDLQNSMPRLWRQFNRRFDYPVVVFNDGLTQEHRKLIVESSENRVWFAYVDDYLDIPDMILKDPARRAALDEVKWSLGYRGMCRFRSGTIFLQPVLRNFEYAMTLDTDGYFPAEVMEDPIAAMHAGGYIYTFSHLLPDLPGAVRHFWDYSLMYMRMKDIHPRSTRILRQFVREDDVQWNYQLYMNDIEIVQLDWFRSDPYQDYFRYLDSMGGFWLHRWGDHAVRTIAVGMWLPQEKVYEMDVPYGHQNYCRCSAAHPDLECVREGDVGGTPAKWWTCARRDAGT